MLPATERTSATLFNGHLRKLIVAGVLFELVWFACVLNPGGGLVFLATAVNLLLHLVLFVAMDPVQPPSSGVRATLLWVSAIGLLGISMDSVLFQLGVLLPASPSAVGVGVPLWLACLWVNFALALRFAFVFLQRSLPLAAIFGAIGGPSSYLAGSKIGGEVLLQSPLPLTLGVLALLWSLFLTGAVALARSQLFTLQTEQEAQ